MHPEIVFVDDVEALLRDMKDLLEYCWRIRKRAAVRLGHGCSYPAATEAALKGTRKPYTRRPRVFQTILQALVPVVFVAGLGWLVGRLGVLDPERIRSITTFIVTVALPAALFVGVFNFSSSQLENGRYLLTLAVALMGTWAVGFCLARIAFRRSTRSAGMLALNASN